MAKSITPKNAALRADLPEDALEFTLTAPWKPDQIHLLSPRTLAYVGDSVFELGLRLRHVAVEVDSSGRLHDSIVALVCANHQARLFDHILPDLSEEEQTLMKTWRNTRLPHRSAGTSRKIYAKSTAFEAWIGFLFLRGETDRLTELFNLAENLPENRPLQPVGDNPSGEE